MNVYYKNEWGELWHGDCLEVMDFLEIVGPVADMVLCDPPYGTTACAWDSVIPFEKMWPRVWACTKDRAAVVMTASQPFTSALVMSQIVRFKYQWVWEKSKASNFLLAKKQPLKAHEDVCVFGSGATCYFPQKTEGKPFKGEGRSKKGSKSDVVNEVPNPTFRNDNVGDRFPRSVQYFKTAECEKVGALHPTQKPVALFAYLIQTYTNPGETVLDFCAGSGTTAVAAEMTGRKWVCIEKEEKYCELIAKRLSARRN